MFIQMAEAVSPNGFIQTWIQRVWNSEQQALDACLFDNKHHNSTVIGGKVWGIHYYITTER
jgi:hypothetical protein